MVDYNIPLALVDAFDKTTDDTARETALEAIENHCSGILIGLIQADYPEAVLPEDADINQDGVTTLVELEKVYELLQERKNNQNLLARFNLQVS